MHLNIHEILLLLRFDILFNVVAHVVCTIVDSKAQPAHHSSLPRNYELVGDFAMPGIL